MPSVFTAFTLAGPAIGGLGLYFDWQIMFWLGVFLAGFNLFLNLKSGAMNFPLFPLIGVIGGALYVMPWYVGAGVGLLVYTLIEGMGEFLPARYWR